MGIVDQTVQDAVRDGGIPDLLVPARDRQLGSKDGGTGLVAIFADLVQSKKSCAGLNSSKVTIMVSGFRRALD